MYQIINTNGINYDVFNNVGSLLRVYASENDQYYVYPFVCHSLVIIDRYVAVYKIISN